MLFSWEEAHGHYVASLTAEAPKHFLHHECLPQLGITLSDGQYKLYFQCTVCIVSLQLIVFCTVCLYCIINKHFLHHEFLLELGIKLSTSH